MSMLFGGPKAPPPPPAPLPPPIAPTNADANVQLAGAPRANAGLGSTMATGPQGLVEPATTSRKSLLGN